MRGLVSNIRVYNSLKRELVPLCISGDALTWYVCGPTVYDQSHLGHGWTYTKFDLIRRVLQDKYGVSGLNLAMGMTDVDDKIIKRSKEKGVSPLSLARHFEACFLRDMDRLNIIRPVRILRVSEHIPDIIAYIERILENKNAYQGELSGSVYFDIASIGSQYHQLTKPPSSNLGASADLPLDQPKQDEPFKSEKRGARDFALWKVHPHSAEGVLGQSLWDSPWGLGRPGWHIECSAMTNTCFGPRLDIHSGGIDLLFPHHENEIAQCLAHNKADQWTDVFLHTGHLNISGQKMSKSLKNFTSINDFLQSNTKNHLRYICLLTKYNQSVELDAKLTAAAQKTEHRFRRLFETYHSAKMDQHASLDKSSSADWPSSADTHSFNKRWGPTEHTVYDALTAARSGVLAGYENDFDFPRAMHHLSQLSNICTSYMTAAGRSSPQTSLCYDLLANAVGFVRNELEILGVDLSDLPGASKTSMPAVAAQDASAQVLLQAYPETVRRLVVTAHKNKDQSRDELIKSLFSASDELRKRLAGAL